MVRTSFRIQHPRRRRDRAVVPGVTRLEDRTLMSASARHTAASGQPDSLVCLPGAAIEQLATDTDVQGYDPGIQPRHPAAPPDADQLLTTTDVQALLERAAAAVNLNNAIIAVVDRNGTILGVRVESGVSPQITENTANLVFCHRRRRLAGTNGSLLR